MSLEQWTAGLPAHQVTPEFDCSAYHQKDCH
jgi:hypothetical protein